MTLAEIRFSDKVMLQEAVSGVSGRRRGGRGMTIRTKRDLCRILGAVAFLAVLGIVGGMDMGIMPVGRGAILAVLSEATGAALLWKGGVIHRWE